MGLVQLLPTDLATQIAAGEVVERPASVVKELVENAIDAGAQRITIVVEHGGKRLVRVEDDGVGMVSEDARISLERHATSKIRSADDLGQIATLGFRGEALPSIASVSRLTLRTRSRHNEVGTEIRVDHGATSEAVDIGMPVGTTVEIADLFRDLPARRKFLKSDAAEAGQINRITTQLALCHPEVGFTLTSAGRMVVRCPPVSSHSDRLFQLLGSRDDLVAVERESGDVRLTGWVAALAEQGPTRGQQNVFVNGRVVKDKTIAHAIIDSYSVAMNKERSPEVYLFLEMPHDSVDVNVHPTKAEVRFRDQSYIHEFVRRALGDALGRGPAPEFRSTPSAGDLAGTTPRLPGSYEGVFPSRWSDGPDSSPEPVLVREALDALGFAPPSAALVTGVEGVMTPSDRALMALGQFRDTYIIAVDEEGIVVVDQHVAHERVLFERITERLREAPLESQRLLEPMVIDLAPGGCQALLAHGAPLVPFGFEIEEFGGDSVKVSAAPLLLRREQCEATIRRLADDLEGLDRGSPAEEALSQLAATMACHAAVKANYPLTSEKMAHILDELRRTAYSTVCPHGRPVMLRLTRRDLEKNFQRI